MAGRRLAATATRWCARLILTRWRKKALCLPMPLQRWPAAAQVGQLYYPSSMATAMACMAYKTGNIRQQFELYDIEKDPNKINNLAANPAFAKELERLKLKLKTFQQNTNDPWAGKWDSK